MAIQDFWRGYFLKIQTLSIFNTLILVLEACGDGDCGYVSCTALDCHRHCSYNSIHPGTMNVNNRCQTIIPNIWLTTHTYKHDIIIKLVIRRWVPLFKWQSYFCTRKS